MEIKNYDFKLGDYVFYPGIGLHRVMKVEHRKQIVSNSRYVSRVWFFQNIRSNAIVQLDFNDIQKLKIRPLMNERNAKRVLRVLLKYLKNFEPVVTTGLRPIDGYTDFSFAYLQSKYNEGTIRSLLRVFHVLSKNKSLAFSERHLLSNTVGQLRYEVCHALNIDKLDPTDLRVIVKQY